MKVSKEARKLSKQLLQKSFTEGRLDATKVKREVEAVIADKPRAYLAALKNYHRLIRLEVEKRHAIIESATPLAGEQVRGIVAKLFAADGFDMTTEFRVNPALLGGLRIKIGSNVWDGSIQNRLANLEQTFATI
jgi:F-type H+-transporting ATPase subunit delta